MRVGSHFFLIPGVISKLNSSDVSCRHFATSDDNLFERDKSTFECEHLVRLPLRLPPKVLIALVARPGRLRDVYSKYELGRLDIVRKQRRREQQDAEASERAIAGGGEQHLVYFNRGSTCLRDCFVSRHHDV